MSLLHFHFPLKDTDRRDDVGIWHPRGRSYRGAGRRIRPSGADSQTSGRSGRCGSSLHQIRRRRDYHRSSDGPQPGGIEEAIKRLAADGVGLGDFQALLDRLSIEPIFTTHPIAQGVQNTD